MWTVLGSPSLKATAKRLTGWVAIDCVFATRVQVSPVPAQRVGGGK